MNVAMSSMDKPMNKCMLYIYIYVNTVEWVSNVKEGADKCNSIE